MPEPAKEKATYNDLYGIPENMTGEIINGELIVTPRPSRRHALASSYLGAEVIPPYCHGRGGGPGGWVILDEPEIKFGENILVPDLAGWRRVRFPATEEENWIAVSPDWVCEVLSPGTARLDRVQKMRIYGGCEVGYAWLIDPLLRTLEVLRLESGRWFLLDAFSESDKVRAEPFQEIEIDLDNLWLEGIGQAGE
ncbi:MAG: Uma2 family endonuclease [Syntrophobacteraceae bacterium]